MLISELLEVNVLSWANSLLALAEHFMQTWYQYSYLTVSNKAKRHISQDARSFKLKTDNG